MARGALGEHAYGGHVKGSTPPNNAPNLNDDGIRRTFLPLSSKVLLNAWVHPESGIFPFQCRIPYIFQTMYFDRPNNLIL